MVCTDLHGWNGVSESCKTVFDVVSPFPFQRIVVGSPVQRHVTVSRSIPSKNKVVSSVLRNTDRKQNFEFINWEKRPKHQGSKFILNYQVCKVCTGAYSSRVSFVPSITIKKEQILSNPWCKRKLRDMAFKVLAKSYPWNKIRYLYCRGTIWPRLLGT